MHNFFRRKPRFSFNKIFNLQRSRRGLSRHRGPLSFLSKMPRKRIYLILALIVLVLVIFSVYYFTRTSSTSDKAAKKEVIKSQQDCTRSVTSFWCESSKQCLASAKDFCADDINNLIVRMESSMNVKFNDLGRENFVWNLKSSRDNTEDTNIYGEGYVAQDISMNKLEALERYLEVNLQASDANVINGISGGLRGYYNNNMACVLDFRYKEMKANEDSVLVPVSDSLNVKFKCGYIPNNQELNEIN